MKIELVHRDEWFNNTTLLEYESDIAPLAGDIYSSGNFTDNHQRFIKQRMILPSCPNCIICFMEYSFPNLLPKKETVTEAEANLIVQESLS